VEIEPFQSALPDLRAVKAGWDWRSAKVVMERGFPRGIAIVLLQPDAQRGVGMVLEYIREVLYTSVQDDVFVDLVVPCGCSEWCLQQLVTTMLMLEEAKIPALVVAAMPDRSTQKVIM
jgi:hypothetical protein